MFGKIPFTFQKIILIIEKRKNTNYAPCTNYKTLFQHEESSVTFDLYECKYLEVYADAFIQSV